MPREEDFGRREEEGMASEQKGIPLEEELARLVASFGWLEGKGTGPDERGMRRELVFGPHEILFG